MPKAGLELSHASTAESFNGSYAFQWADKHSVGIHLFDEEQPNGVNPLAPFNITRNFKVCSTCVALRLMLSRVDCQDHFVCGDYSNQIGRTLLVLLGQLKKKATKQIDTRAIYELLGNYFARRHLGIVCETTLLHVGYGRSIPDEHLSSALNGPSLVLTHIVSIA